MQTTISSKFQTTIPKKIREQLSLSVSDYLYQSAFNIDPILKSSDLFGLEDALIAIQTHLP